MLESLFWNGWSRSVGTVEDLVWNMHASENGKVTVISNSKRHGCVTEETLKSFSEGRKVRIYQHKSKYSPIYLVNRARQQLGSKYSLFGGNCEHFVRWVHHLKPESPQLAGFTMLVAAALLLFAASR